ncbi:Pre-rRNA-processing protein TSR2 conserved region [Euphorbia peplus]|nr:Pre-rRNA-processing protein TSR2 conserved region [Euphorbia peplus]
MAFSTINKDALSNLRDTISLLLSQWHGLQLAVKNQWGGRDSLQKSQQLATEILCWFFQPRGPSYVEDLENLLHESLLLSFNTDIEDGSIEQVAERLIMVQEEFFQRYN